MQPQQQQRVHRWAEGDRYIPVRDENSASAFLVPEASATAKAGENARAYREALGIVDQQSRLRFAERRSQGVSSARYERQMRTLDARLRSCETSKAPRKIPSEPHRTLDAPNSLDDYYLNLLDWGSCNQICVALGQRVYLWDPLTLGITELHAVSNDDHYVSSVSFSPDGSMAAIGTSSAELLLYDVERLKCVYSMSREQSLRIGSIAWQPRACNTVLATGDRNAKIQLIDARLGRAAAEVNNDKGHTQEVCALKWSPEGDRLASGGNDNICCVWSAARIGAQPDQRIDRHQAAVKAIAWSPHRRGMLATGGGTADRMLFTWNTLLDAPQILERVDTRSQVCALVWSSRSDELISSHGFARFEISLWRARGLSRTASLYCHTSRVLHLAQSPDGCDIASLSPDETMRFWRIHGEPPARSSSSADECSNLRCASHYAQLR